MSFVVSDYSLGRQRCRQWASLITQQLRLRHVDQVYVYNLQSDKKSSFYFTLHRSNTSASFYTSEKVLGRYPKWKELLFKNLETNYACIVIKIWKSNKNEDEIIITWGVHFSGLVYLGSKIADLHPRHFKENTVIFFMQGGFFTSQNYIKTDLDKVVPFYKYLNLIEKDNNELVLYKRIAIKAPKGEVQSTYTLDKLRQLQELQRLIKNKKIDVENVISKIKATENEQIAESGASSHSNISFGHQLLTMNSLNKMLHGKPTRSEREKMTKLSREIEVAKFRIRLLTEERDKKKARVEQLKKEESRLCDENDDRNSRLMSFYHSLNRDMERLKEYNYSFLHHKEHLMYITRQLYFRQKQLLKELLFIYPIEKIPNENKYTMLGIYLPNSELLTDCSDPGVSVVLGYICHILIMCSIFFQVPLRYPMKHLGSRSVIYDQVSSLLPDKEREFQLYAKGKDKAHFGYAVFLLNKNLSQLRWYFYHWYTLDLKETLKHLYHFLIGLESGEVRYGTPVLEDSFQKSHTASSKAVNIKCPSDSSVGTPAGNNTERPMDSFVSLDKLVSLSLSSTSSSNINDPLLDSIYQEIKKVKLVSESPASKSPSRRISLFKNSHAHSSRRNSSKGSSEVLALPEAYLNKQISKDLFDRCASGRYKFSDKQANIGNAENYFNRIKVRSGIEEHQANTDITNSEASDVIEEGTDPLDPSTNLDSIITKSITIRPESACSQNIKFSLQNKRISRSAGSYVDDEVNSFLSDPLINVSCDKAIGNGSAPINTISVEQQNLLEEWLSNESNLLQVSSEISGGALRASLQDLSSPLTARTDRLMSANQSFNLVKHRNE
ncbi:uncharacterized protein LOC115883148 [Sitophilus oryzae]|uniref:Uncharacterized protein LOC115883148 n=1 Tax=Sitophilus oryzae TaxID=7048 RepID=A0A6J2Y0Q3_SITOR|nr:uncharacterized protein LOC115883148 [Sitophilus oryzae]